MSADPDLLAILRRRRQDGRCLHCNTPTPRASLCPTCRQTLCYCPRCECLYPVSQSSARRRTLGRCAVYCIPCNSAVRRQNARRRLRADYLTERRAAAHPQLARIAQLYRAGLTYTDIASVVGLTRGGLSALITRSRKRGLWPKTLRRM